MMEFKKILKSIMTEIIQYNTLITLSLAIAQATTFILSFLLGISFWIASVFIAVIHFLYYTLTKDVIAVQYKFKYFNYMFGCIVFALYSVFTGVISGIGLPKELIIAILVLSAIVILFGATTSYNNEDFKETCLEYIDKNIFKLEQIISDKSGGDVVLGKDKETGKDVVMPFDDRFLHTLVLGPTGSGKTSQILTPLIHQDMQNKEIGIIVLEPKGDFAKDVYGLAKYYNRKGVVYFDPQLNNCPYFNPLMGPEDDVIENIVTTFKMLDSGSSTFFSDHNEGLLRRSIKILKRLYANRDYAPNLIELDTLLNDTNGLGTAMVNDFVKLPTRNSRVRHDNKGIAAWFLSDYYSGAKGEKGATKTFEHTSGVRNQISKLISNSYLNKVLNPRSKEELEKNGYLDFERILSNGEVCCINSCQGILRDLGKFLGYFLILQLQSSVFKRPGDTDTRRGCMLYIDEFQTYANLGFGDMLTQGRSYRVASHLATQNRALIGMNSGKNAKVFLDLVSTNARNKIIFPGGDYDDAEYYSRLFGEVIVKKSERKVSRQIATPFNMFGGKPPSESIGVKEVRERLFSPTDIIYKEFGEVAYSLVQDKTLRAPGMAKIQFISKEIKAKSTALIKEHIDGNLFNPESEDEPIVRQIAREDDDEFSVFSVDDEEYSVKNMNYSLDNIFNSSNQTVIDPFGGD